MKANPQDSGYLEICMDHHDLVTVSIGYACIISINVIALIYVHSFIQRN